MGSFSELVPLEVVKQNSPSMVTDWEAEIILAELVAVQFQVCVPAVSIVSVTVPWPELRAVFTTFGVTATQFMVGVGFPIAEQSKVFPILYLKVGETLGTMVTNVGLSSINHMKLSNSCDKQMHYLQLNTISIIYIYLQISQKFAEIMCRCNYNITKQSINGSE